MDGIEVRREDNSAPPIILCEPCGKEFIETIESAGMKKGPILFGRN
jgi:hypothetical protein